MSALFAKEKGHGGLDCIRLLHAKSASTAVVYLHGAHVTSFVVDGRETLFVSDRAVYDGAKAIRGGIPVCWPQFGPFGPLGQHGFARNHAFTLLGVEETELGETAATFRLAASDATRAVWDFDFTLDYTVTLDARALTVTLKASCPDGAAAFDFTGAVHTYLALPARSTRLANLRGVTYMDQLQERKEIVEANDEVDFTQETDRVYLKVPGTIVARAADVPEIVIEPFHMPDAVVWNPWVAKAKAMGDFGDDEFENMVCIESAWVGERQRVAPGSAVQGSQTIHVLQPAYTGEHAHLSKMDVTAELATAVDGLTLKPRWFDYVNDESPRAAIDLINRGYDVEDWFKTKPRVDEVLFRNVGTRPDCGMLVFEDARSGDLVATLQLEVDPEAERTFFGMFTIDKKYQGAGLGTAIINRAKALAKQAGSKTLAMCVLNVRTELIPFYLKRGFVETKQTPFSDIARCRRDVELIFHHMQVPVDDASGSQ